MPTDTFDRLAASRGKKRGVRGLMRAASSLDPLSDGPTISRDVSSMDRSSAPYLSRASSPMDERETLVRSRSTSPMDEVESAKSDYSSAPRRRYSGPIPQSAMQLLPGGDIIMGAPDLMGLQKAIHQDLDREDAKRFEVEDRKWQGQERQRKLQDWSYQDFERQLAQQQDEVTREREAQKFGWAVEDRQAKARQLEQEQARQTQQDKLDFFTKFPEVARRYQQIGMPELAQAYAKMNGYEGPMPAAPAYPQPVDPGLLEIKAEQLPAPKSIRHAFPQEIEDLANQGSQFMAMLTSPYVSVLQDRFSTQSQRDAAKMGIAAARRMLLDDVVIPRLNKLGLNTSVTQTDPTKDPAIAARLYEHEEKAKITRRHARNPAMEKALAGLMEAVK